MTTIFPLVRAVTAPRLDAPVLFDFNDEGVWASGTPATSGALADGWTLGTPERLSAPGDDRSAWGPRRPAFQIEIRGDRYKALEAHSRLARWLMRPTGWLFFQLDAGSPPVWLRMIAADVGDLSFDEVYNDRIRPDYWTVGCSFVAEPFLYGNRVTLTDVTLDADPASGTFAATLPEILGDAPSRLRITVDPAPNDSGSDVDSADLALAVAPGAPVVWQAESFTLGTGATSEVDAGSSGGARVRIDFTSPAMAARFSGNAPVPVPAGTYRVLARGRNLSASKPVPCRLAVGSTYGDTVAWPTSAADMWVELGTFAIPAGLVNLPDVAGGDVTPSVTFEAGADNLGTSDDLAVDAFVLVPVRLVNDYTEATALNVSTAGLWASMMLDGDYEVPYAMSGDGAVAAAQGAISLTGGWLEVRPGSTNVLTGVRADSASLSGSLTVSASYHPRWVWLAAKDGNP